MMKTPGDEKKRVPGVGESGHNIKTTFSYIYKF